MGLLAMLAVIVTSATVVLYGKAIWDPVDLASRLTQDHHQSLKLWLRMLSCTVRIENEIRSRLRATFDITLPRFDLMAQLERFPQGLRMGVRRKGRKLMNLRHSGAPTGDRKTRSSRSSLAPSCHC